MSRKGQWARSSLRLRGRQQDSAMDRWNCGVPSGSVFAKAVEKGFGVEIRPCRPRSHRLRANQQVRR